MRIGVLAAEPFFTSEPLGLITIASSTSLEALDMLILHTVYTAHGPMHDHFNPVPFLRF